MEFTFRCSCKSLQRPSAPAMNRLYRRLIVRHFGSTKNFLMWIAAVIATIYVIDTYILTKDRLVNIVGGASGGDDVKKMDQQGSANKPVESNNPAVILEPADPPKNSLKDPPKELPKDPPKDPPKDLPKDPKMELQKKADDDEKRRKKEAEDAKVKIESKNEPPKSPPAAKDAPGKTGAKCGLKEECPVGQYAYYIQSGEGRDMTPTICFNGHYAMNKEQANGKRGLNVVIVNDKTLAIEDVRNFDTYQEDTMLMRFLKLGIQDNHLLLAASQDEASFNLKEGRKWLKSYGSTLIDKLGFRDGIVMIGQKGLNQGEAKEAHQARGGDSFATSTKISGCIAVPIGKLQPLKLDKEAEKEKSLLNAGEELPNCGVKEGCGPNSFPVHLFSGKENKEGPKLCVSGKYVLAKGLNDGGRGFNIVIVDPGTKDVVRVGHFDTYAEDSSNLEIFLEMMNEKEIILGVTHDDASKNLNLHAQKILESLGSSMLTKMSFRDVWGFVGQKGLEGHSPFEEIEFAGPSNAWPRPIDRKMCVPTEIKGSKIKPDPLANKNEKRRKFCAKYDGYGDFCETEHVDEMLTPAPLTDKALESHAIYQVPIIIIPGLNHNAVRMQLETLIMNPGVKPDMVTVMYDAKFDEPSSLAEIFSFKTAKLSSSTKYVYQVKKALEKVWELYPEAKYVIVLEEEVILGPDFLFFMAQCLPTLDGDDTLIGISAFNENGYQGLSSVPGVAYRQELFPGLGFLLKKSFYDSAMKPNMDTCCMKRSWDGWLVNKLGDKEMIVPDVSRVYRRPYEGLSEQADFLKELFNRDRVTNLEAKPKLKNSASLTKYKYEEELQELIKSSTVLDTSNVGDCLAGKGLGFYIPETSGKVFTVYFEQENKADHRILSLLCKCFRLFYLKGYPSRGLHNGMLRFTYKGNTLIFMGSSTPYYRFMPKEYKVIKRSEIPS